MIGMRKLVYASPLYSGIILADVRTKRMETFNQLIMKLEKKRKSRIFSIIHCDDKDDHICGPTLQGVLDNRVEIRNIPVLELLLHSPGGNADIAYQVVRVLRRHCQRLNVIVPLWAKSAATLMCLGADAIYMGEFADLGPIDVQLNDPIRKGSKSISPLDEFKSAEFLRDYAVEILDFFTALIIRRSGMSVQEALRESVAFTTGIMRPLYEQLNPLEIGEYKRSLAIGEDYAQRLLSFTKNPKRKEIVEALVSRYPSHSFVIDALEARMLGLPVHPLDQKQENMFLEALQCIITNEDSIYGFAKVPAKKPAATPKGKTGKTKRPPVSAPRPTAISAAAG